MLSRDASMSSFRATAAAWRMASRLAVASRRGARVVGVGMAPSYASCTPLCKLATIGTHVEQSSPEPFGDRRRPVADAQFRVDAEQMRLHGGLAEVQPCAGVTVGGAV